MTVQELLDGKLKCSCGRPHHCDIETVIMQKHALHEIPRLLKGRKYALMVSDNNTKRVCGHTVLSILQENGIQYTEAHFNTTTAILPDDDSLEFLRRQMNESIDVIIGVGSGTINDLCKAIGAENHLPVMTVITAPSMDGIATSVSVLIRNGLKVTVPTKTPNWIICDLSILYDAPIDMIRSGIGDVLGKYSALCDWKLAHLLYDEPFCPEICQCVDEKTKAFVKQIDHCLNREPQAIAALTASLVSIGILAAFMDNSRPGSGSEHLLAHYLELTGMIHHAPYYTHGIDVGFSSVLIEKVRKRLAAEDPARFRETFDQAHWENEIRRVCGVLADEVIALQAKSDMNSSGRLPKILLHWEEIKQLLLETPDEYKMLQLLDRTGISMETCISSYGESKLRDAICYAGDLKTRYTLLTLLRDVGLSEQYAEEMTL